ncbi:hypothetical protein MNBD_GAMMA12-3362 [hydrothermal vent metagenome]|uniref:General secretion pathway protein L n=1 Tax=hydrothermal vent metagenome TaxID=652676 RepID=A0A3B0Y115_9ZZZZ
MRDNLFILINDSDPTAVDSIVANKARHKTPHHGSLEDLQKTASNKRVILIIDSFNVLLSTTTIPTRNKQRLTKAVPFALEEFLISDPEDQVFALAPHYSNTEQSVAVIERSYLNQQLALLKKYNINAEMVVPDIFLLPTDLQTAELNSWIVATDSHKFIIRSGKFSGFSIDKNNLQTLFASRHFSQGKNTESNQKQEPNKEQKHNQTPQQIIFIQTATNTDSTDHNKQALTQWGVISRQHDIKLVAKNFSGDLLSLYARSFSEKDCINLTQNVAKNQQRHNNQIKQWKFAGVAAALLLLMFAVFSGIEYQAMSSESSRLKAESRKIFKQVFPNARRFVKMRLRMRSALSQIGGNPKQSSMLFMEILGLSGNTIRQIKSFQLSTVNFRNGKLNIHFMVDQANKIDLLEKGLTSSGLVVSRGASNKTSQGYTGVLSISGARGKP